MKNYLLKNVLSFQGEIFLLISILFLLIWFIIEQNPISFKSNIKNIFIVNKDLQKKKKQDKRFLITYIGEISLIILLVTCFLLCFTSTSTVTIFNGTLINSFSLIFFKKLIIISSMILILISFQFLKFEKINIFEYYILYLFSILSSLLFISSNDFLALFLTLELLNLCLYVLTAYNQYSAFSTEAGIKYFILGSFSSGLYLFGCSLIYGFTGILNFENLAKFLLDFDHIIFSSLDSGIIIGFFFIVISFFFKLTIVPFHMWGPDIYEGSLDSISAFLLIIPKIILVVFLTKMCYFLFYSLYFIYKSLFLFSGLFSILISTFYAIKQTRIKRFIAYSSIGHMGFILIGLSTGLIEGLHSSLFYIIIYIITSLNFWAIFLSLRVQTFNNKSKNIHYITDLTGLYKTNPILAFLLSLNLLSLSGIPPLIGFYGKIFILIPLINSSFYFISIVIILMSIISCFYYLRIIKIIYFDKKINDNQFCSIPPINAWVISITSYLILFFIFFPTWLENITVLLVLLFNK